MGVGSPHSPRLRAGQLSDCNLSKQAGLYRTFLPNHKSPQAQGRPGWGFLAMATVWCKGGMCICAKWSGWRSLSKQSQSRGTVGQEEWQEQWAGARALLSLCPESSGQYLSLAVTDEATGSVLCRFRSQGPPLTRPGWRGWATWPSVQDPAGSPTTVLFSLGSGLREQVPRTYLLVLCLRFPSQGTAAPSTSLHGMESGKKPPHFSVESCP